MPSGAKSEIPTTPKRGKAFNQKYISARELAFRWGVSDSAIYHGKCDARLLHRVQFGRSVRFLLHEVEALEARKEGLAA
jgi:predicted DNA-binding transcriptional regulator AlpA